MFPRGSRRSQATWELAPSTPWQATSPVWGKTSPPAARETLIRSSTRVGEEISSAWRDRASSNRVENRW